MDRWLDYALWLTLRELVPAWLPEVQAGRLDFGGDPKKLVFALQAAGTTDVAGPLRKLLDGGKLTGERRSEVCLLLVRHGDTAAMGHAIQSSGAWGNPEAVARLLAEAEQAVRLRKVAAPPDIAGTLNGVMVRYTGPARQSAARLAGLWKLEDLRRDLEGLARDKVHPSDGPPVEPAKVSDDDRRAAFDGLVALGGEKSTAFLAWNDYDLPRRRAWAATALGRLDLSAGAKKAAGLFSVIDPADLSELVAAFAERKGGLAALTAAANERWAKSSLPPDLARVGVRAAKAAGKDGDALATFFTKFGGLSEHKWAITGDELAKFLAELSKADPVRGEAIYRRTELQCLKCHAIAGAGGLVGPEMTSLGGSAQPDYLLESLLVPNAKVKEGYNALAVSTADGRQVTGIKVRESDAELVLRDAEGKLVTLPKADIEGRKDAPSLMPAGLVDALTRQELLDLTRFLSELGKGKFAAKPGGAVRAWETVDARPVFGLLGRKGFGAVATEPGLGWRPVYSEVSGDLPLAELPRFWLDKAAPLAVARFTVERTTAGKLVLKLPDATGLSLWLDGVPVAAAGTVTVDVGAGSHVVTVGVELAKRTVPLRVELE